MVLLLPSNRKEKEVLYKGTFSERTSKKIQLKRDIWREGDMEISSARIAMYRWLTVYQFPAGLDIVAHR